MAGANAQCDGKAQSNLERSYENRRDII
jgi:hypothetical protein